MTPLSIELTAPAKVNLFLEVVNKRPDGYHTIDSLFAETSLCDRITASPGEGDAITIVCSDPAIPAGESNLVYKAVDLLRRRFGITKGMHFSIDKAIPAGAGLGGGSSDAATALRLVNLIWDMGLSDGELAALAAEIGSDVPYFIYGGCCRCRGRGESIEKLPVIGETRFLGLLLSNIISDTALAYRGIRLPASGEIRSPERMITEFGTPGNDTWHKNGFNRFQPSVLGRFPPLAEVVTLLEREIGIKAILSGSGSALWFHGDVEQVREAFQMDTPLGRLARQAGMRVVPVSVRV